MRRVREKALSIHPPTHSPTHTPTQKQGWTMAPTERYVDWGFVLPVFKVNPPTHPPTHPPISLLIHLLLSPPLSPHPPTHPTPNSQ